MNIEITPIEVLKEDRELTNFEYLNLCNKANNGTMPVEYFRKNLFNATTKISKQLRRDKLIYDDGKLKIKVNRSLHQKHRDLLSIIFTDNRGIGKPSNDGSYLIYHNLYDMAKKMGYKKPLDAIHLIKDWLYDLRHTDFIYETDKYEHGHMALGEYFLEKETGKYAVKIPSSTAKFHILNYAVEIPREINRKIIAIPNNLAKTKALVSYMLSNQALKNGIGFDNLCDKLDIKNENKSRFKKELIENIDILQEFNITFNEESKIFKYEQIETIKFHAPVSIEKIIECIDLSRTQQKEESKEKEEVYKTPSLFGEDELREELNINEERYKKIISAFINSVIVIENNKYIFIDLKRNENGEILLLLKASLQDEKTLQANTRFTSYYAVYGAFFKE